MLFPLLLSLSLFSGLMYFVWKQLASDLAYRNLFWPALLLKILSGCLIGVLYAKGGDTMLYQQKAALLTNFAKEDFRAYLRLLFFNEVPPAEMLPLGKIKTYSNSFFFLKPISLLNFITGSNYYLNSLFLSLFSFAGAWFFVRVVARVFPGGTKAAIISFLFVPSVVFWASGMLKESLLFGSLCFFWGSVLQLVYQPQIRFGLQKILLLLVSGYVLWKIKFFLAALVFCLTGAWVILRWLQQRFSFFRTGIRIWLVLPVILFVLAAFIMNWSESFELQHFFDRLVWNYQKLQSKSPGRPVITLQQFEPNAFSVISNIPIAILNVVYRPFFWEGNNFFYRLAGLENLALLSLTFGLGSLFKKENHGKLPGFYLVLLAYILFMAAVFGLSTPNFGSLNRYRIAILPFLIYLLLQLPFWQNLLARLGQKYRQLR